MDIVRLRDIPQVFWRVIVLLLVLACVAAIFGPMAWSAPKAQSAQECHLAGDMAVTAASLAIEGVPREKAEPIMLRIYSLNPERGVALMRANRGCGVPR